MDKPNILLITTDTQRCDTLAFMGHPHALSPNLDRLAAEGVWFEDAYTASPVCSPARCSLLTGVYPPVHGCIENGIGRRDDLPVFPDLLKAQGYWNIMVGKTHFGPIPSSFDVVHHTGEKKQDIPDAYASFIRRHGFPRAASVPNPVPEHLCQDAFIVDTTMQEIDRWSARERSRQQGGGRPFFAYCSMVSPHGPFDPPGSWASLYDGVQLPPVRYEEGELERMPRQLINLLGLHGEKAEQLRRMLSTAEGRTQVDAIRRLYYGLTAYCDDQIGRLLDYLNTRGLRESTLILFTSDHGATLFDHGFNDKHNYYDTAWRVPLIMSMPGTLPQGRKMGFAAWTDITATIVGAAGADCDTMQGFNLFAPLAQGSAPERICVAATLYQSAALCTKRWKLEYYFTEGSGRLFDRLRDPSEHRDLYSQPAYESLRNELVAALLNWHAGLLDWHRLKTHATDAPEGHVAVRVTDMVARERALSCEIRLNDRMAAL